MKRTVIILVALCVVALVFANINSKKTDVSTTPEVKATSENTGAADSITPKVEESNITDEKERKEYSVTDESNPIATIEMENGEKIIIELYPKIAPKTVNNFISLAKSGFYNGVIFHRVIPNFMIQGGDPDGNGRGGPGYCIFGEFTDNSFENNLSHSRGVVSMARRGDRLNPASAYNSAGSQFFICVADSEFLNNQYAAFGKVVYGMETADSIVSVQRNSMDKPLTDQKIKELTVDTKGIEYPEPEKMPII